MAVIGIDFGTEFSSVTVKNEDGEYEAIPDDQGKIRISSCVSFHEEEIRVGNLAELKREFNVKNTIYDIKMLIGISFKKGVKLKSKYRWPFVLLEDSEGRMQVQVHYLKSVHTFYPEEIVSIFFRHLIENAEKRLQRQNVCAAVISVSNSFNHSQRRAIIDSARIAKLEVKGLLNDTTAAAVYYAFVHQNHKEKISANPTPTLPPPTAMTTPPTTPTPPNPTPTTANPPNPTPQPSTGHDTRKGELEQKGCIGNTESKSQERSCNELIMLISIGAGTFSVSICRIDNNSHVEVVRSYGESSLGGRDVNREIFARLKHDYRANVGLKNSLDQVKKEFSSSERRHTAIDIRSTDSKMEHQENISRETFEEACILLKSSLESAIEKTSFCRINGKYKITKVLLAGGSTRLPLMNMLLERFDLSEKVEQTYVKTDEIVALGACIMANKLSKERKLEGMIREKLSYGIHHDGKETLVTEEASLPAKFEETITGETSEILDEDGARMLMVKKQPQSSLSSYTLIIDVNGLISVLPKEMQAVADGLPKAKIGELINQQSQIRKSNFERKIAEQERYRMEKVVLHIKKECAAIEKWIEDNQNSTLSDCQLKMQEFAAVLQHMKENLDQTLKNTGFTLNVEKLLDDVLPLFRKSLQRVAQRHFGYSEDILQEVNEENKELKIRIKKYEVAYATLKRQIADRDDKIKELEDLGKDVPSCKNHAK